MEWEREAREDPSTASRIYAQARQARRKVRSSIQTLSATVELLSLEDVFSKTVGRLPESGFKRVILVVEDDVEVANLYAKMLRDVDFNLEIIQAHNRATAMVCCRAFSFDLAVIDLRLPDGSGSDVVWEVRIRNPKSPILVISGDLPELEALQAKVGLIGMVEVFEKTGMYACVKRISVLLSVAGTEAKA